MKKKKLCTHTTKNNLLKLINLEKLFYGRQNNIVFISALDQFRNARVFCTVMHYIIFYTAVKKKKKIS